MGRVSVRATQPLEYDLGYQPAGSVFYISDERFPKGHKQEGKLRHFGEHCMQLVDPSVPVTDLAAITVKDKGKVDPLASAVVANASTVAAPNGSEGNLKKAAAGGEVAPEAASEVAPQAQGGQQAKTGKEATGDKKVI